MASDPAAAIALPTDRFETHDAPAPHPRKALVIADDIGVFLAVARSLGRGGVEVDVATCGEHFPGLRSRYIRKVHELPAYLRDSAAWARALGELVERENYRLVFPANDSALALLARNDAQIEPYRLAIPAPEVLAAFSDKRATRALAQELGVAVANGVTIQPGTEPAEVIRKLGLPVVLKPARSYLPDSSEAKTAARIVRQAEGIGPALAQFAGHELIAESFFEGEGAGLSLLARDGHVELAWQHRRLAAVDETGRSCRRTGEPPDPRLLADAAALARATRLTGVAMFEFRRNPDSGKHILVEVNPRFWGSLPLALAGGADFPLRLWAMLTGDEISADPAPLRPDTRQNDLSGELDRLSNALGWAQISGLARLLAGSVATPTRFDSWASDDPAPYLAELRMLARRIGQTAMRRILQR